MEGNCKARNEEELMKMKPGDLIRFYDECDERWAVFGGNDEKGEQIIHWSMESDVDCSPRIKFDLFWTFAKKMVAVKENRDCTEHVNVVERTKYFKQILEKEETKGEDILSYLFYSSEHFAKWCHYGLGGLDRKWCPLAPALVIDITKVTNVVEFVEGIFTNHTSDGKAIRRNVDVLRQLQPGDIVRFSRGSYKHWATYIGQDKDKKSLKSVIHWWDNDSATDPYIRIVPFWELAGNCTAEKINSDLPDNNAIAECEAVKTAEALINKSELPQKGQDVKAEMFHCSEDFAKWFYLKLMGKDQSTASMERLTEELSFKRVNCWKCCEHDIVSYLGNGRHLLNEEVLLTLEHGKFSQILVQILQEMRLEWLHLELLHLRTIESFLERHREDDRQFGVFMIHFVGTIESFLERHREDDRQFGGYISRFVRTIESKSMYLSWKRCREYVEQLDIEYIRHVESMSGKEYKKTILHIVGLVSEIEWQSRKGTECHIEEPDKRTLHLDPCAMFTRRKNVEISKKLKPGDLMKFVKSSCNHWGLYIGLIDGLRRVFHWTADEHVTEPDSSATDVKTCKQGRPCIELMYLEDLERAEKLEKVSGDKLEDTIIDGDEVVKRAQAFEVKIRVGEESGKDFSDLFNDCEHFAKWCRYRLGLKSLKISKEQIEKIEDIRNFVKGEFSVIPWLIDSNEDTPVSRMRQLKKSKAE